MAHQENDSCLSLRFPTGFGTALCWISTVILVSIMLFKGYEHAYVISALALGVVATALVRGVEIKALWKQVEPLLKAYGNRLSALSPKVLPKKTDNSDNPEKAENGDNDE